MRPEVFTIKEQFPVLQINSIIQDKILLWWKCAGAPFGRTVQQGACHGQRLCIGIEEWQGERQNDRGFLLR
ncbi:hypothetical protein L861_01720 [Litchfieldella anticariensis FP35 = DSM 16096]|uniref:Uncharacterized protein n=1 Tax=Litchfieldella anticariensis (strain DSM 16096 / CECT 5854 / CIP 108499 / LMG 22089 / FP35) TaxID=1121939 RepID=S2L893_LITA3|nr:hypothetical protein L861_01720 [Halomonas anticariensis FP35 = DSM 16096]